MKHLSWEAFSSKVFIVMFLAICTFAAHEIAKLSENVSKLNEKMAVVLYSFEENKTLINTNKMDISDLSKRVYTLEITCIRH